MSQLAKLARGLLFSIIHLVAEIGNALNLTFDHFQSLSLGLFRGDTRDRLHCKKLRPMTGLLQVFQ
jgi:hypothetical protein